MRKWLITYQHRSWDHVPGRGVVAEGPEIEMAIVEVHPAVWLLQAKQAELREPPEGEIVRKTRILGILSAIEIDNGPAFDAAREIKDLL